MNPVIIVFMFCKIITTTTFFLLVSITNNSYADMYIRTDVRLAIRNQQPTKEQERASLYLAGVLEKSISLKNPSASQLHQLAQEISLATVCLFDVYGKSGGKQSVMIENMVLNTPFKQQLYDVFNRSISGTMQELPSTSECDHLR